MMFDLAEAIGILRVLDLRCGCQVLPGGGMLIWLGDMNDRQAEITLPSDAVGSAPSWLLQAARRVYPEQFLKSAPKAQPLRQIRILRRDH